MLSFLSPLWHLCVEQCSVLLPLKCWLQYCLLWLLCSTEQIKSIEKEEQSKPQQNLNHKLHEHRLAIESKRLEGREQRIKSSVLSFVQAGMEKKYTIPCQ